MSAILVKQTIKQYKEGEIIFRENDIGSEMFIIMSGKVEISRKNNGSHVILEVLSPKSFFGEMALFAHHKRIATATALEDSSLIVITKQMLDTQLRNVPEWFVIMFKALVQRLEKADKRLTK